MAELPFQELSGTINVPGVYAETDLVSGVTSLATKDKKVLILGYATASTYDDEIFQITSKQFAKDKWGTGSQMAIMAEAVLDIAPLAPVYGMSYVESAGATATGTVTFGAGPATGSGSCKAVVGGRTFVVPILHGDTADTTGGLLADEINKNVDLPFTAANVGGVVTITARNAGAEANTIRLRAKLSASVTVTTLAVSGATLSGGTLAGNPTTALSGATSERFHIIVLNNDDSTAYLALETHIGTVSTAFEQKWCMGIVAETSSTLSDATTTASALDNYRVQVVQQLEAEEPIFEVAARFAGVRASVTDPAAALDWKPVPGLHATNDRTKWMTYAEENGQISGGVTVLSSKEDGSVEVVRSINSRVTSPAFIDSQIMEISDYLDTDFIAHVTRLWAGKKMKYASVAGTPNTVTPNRMLKTLHERMRLWDRLDYVQGTETIIKNNRTVAVVNTDDPLSRMDVGYDFFPVGTAHVIAVLKTLVVPIP